MTSRLLIPLLMLSALVGAGMEAESCEAAEQEVPIAVAIHSAASVQFRLRRTASETPPGRQFSANPARRWRAVRERITTPLAPHGRPDNTRGDPIAC